jgi:hypothetical protein
VTRGGGGTIGREVRIFVFFLLEKKCDQLPPCEYAVKVKFSPLQALEALRVVRG